MLDELILFVDIVKAGSFTEASKLLGISASTITRRIQRLETHLNLVLLKRNTHNVELSSSGKQLFDKYSNLKTDFEETVANIGIENNNLRGAIKVVLPPFFALKIITPYLNDFLIKHPDINLEICYKLDELNLVSENYDLAITNEKPKHKNQKMRLICRSKIIFYCYPEYIEQFGLPTTPKHLEEHLKLEIILTSGMTANPLYLINKNTGQIKIFRPKYQIRQDCGIHDQEFIRSGLTIGSGIDLMLKNDIDSGKIVHLLPEYYILGHEYYLLITPEGKNARTNAFIDFINECVQRLNLDETFMLE